MIFHVGDKVLLRKERTGLYGHEHLDSATDDLSRLEQRISFLRAGGPIIGTVVEVNTRGTWDMKIEWVLVENGEKRSWWYTGQNFPDIIPLGTTVVE